MLYAAGLAAAANFTPMAANSSSGHANVSGVVSTNSSYANVSKRTENIAISYLWGKLGQPYYNRYISFNTGTSYGNLSYVYFTYNVPFSNGTEASGTFGGVSPLARMLGITVTINDSFVTGYVGPSEPYIINISAARALSIAREYGITSGAGNATERIEGVVNRNSTLTSGYAIVWAVTSGSPFKGSIYRGIYIDVKSGKAVGEYVYNPQILATQQSYGTEGNFSLFYMQNQSIQAQNQTGANNNASSGSNYIVPLIMIGIVIFIGSLYFSRRR
ncbi:MAG: hypothetical protein KGH67_02200 [Candidatus Micrarchaeota archaeon]|nr:hypothetical protein [Candidatus Micrarchaeota archaeon]